MIESIWSQLTTNWPVTVTVNWLWVGLIALVLLALLGDVAWAIWLLAPHAGRVVQSTYRHVTTAWMMVNREQAEVDTSTCGCYENQSPSYRPNRACRR